MLIHTVAKNLANCFLTRDLPWMWPVCGRVNHLSM